MATWFGFPCYCCDDDCSTFFGGGDIKLVGAGFTAGCAFLNATFTVAFSGGSGAACSWFYIDPGTGTNFLILLALAGGHWTYEIRISDSFRNIIVDGTANFLSCKLETACFDVPLDPDAAHDGHACPAMPATMQLCPP